MPVVPEAICAVAVTASSAVKEKPHRLLTKWLKRYELGVGVFIVDLLIAPMMDRSDQLNVAVVDHEVGKRRIPASARRLRL
jgi:hypothetical protein